MGQGNGHRPADANPEPSAALRQALKLHRAGRVAEAERLYRQALADDPKNVEALHLLGVAALQQGRAEEAVSLIGQAAKRLKNNAQVHNNLGEAYRALGRMEEAADSYKRAIARDASDPAPHNNLGNVLAATGKAEEAAASYRRALKITPDDAEVLANLGDALSEAGKPEEAIAQFERAITVAPGFVEAHVSLGRVLKDLHRLADAEAACRRAVKLAPNHAGAHGALGTVLAAKGDLAGAVEAYRRAVALAPDDATALTNLGNAVQETGAFEEAIACHRRAVALDPDNAAAHHNLAVALQKQGDEDAAVASFERALKLRPGYVEALSNLGRLHQQAGRLEAAADRFRGVLARDPDDIETVNNFGLCLLEMGMADDAIDSYRQAIARRPDHPDLRMNYGLALMRMGRFVEAWPEYEWRWLTEGHKAKPIYPQPEWKGEDPVGKTILVWGEQGVGDEIMFAGMVPDLIEQGASVVLECEPRLAPLYRRSFVGVDCIVKEEPPATETQNTDIDFQVATGGLGRWLRPDLASFPGLRSYLVADAKRRDAFKAKYRKRRNDGLLVGVAWISKNKRLGRHKSIKLADLAPLAAMPKVTLVDLQYGDTAAEREAFEQATGTTVIHDAAVDQMASLDDFAAQVAAMDLVITVSNTTAHMAGALGVPAWVLLHSVPLACWMLQRDDSPWYPSLRLFRQSRRGEWSAVIERIAAALRATGIGAR